MALIEMRPEDMRICASSLAAIGEEDQEIIRQIRVMVMGLEEIWKGSAQEAFIASFMNAGAQISDLANMIQSLAALLGQAAQEAENEDAALQNMIAGL